jgi:hypothetical protein
VFLRSIYACISTCQVIAGAFFHVHFFGLIFEDPRIYVAVFHPPIWGHEFFFSELDSCPAMVSFLIPILLTVLVLVTTLPRDSRSKRDPTAQHPQSFVNHSQTTVSHSYSTTSAAPTSTSVSPSPSNCFPALDFETPSTLPDSTEGWWCDPTIEYAFVGFSYEVTPCEFAALKACLKYISLQQVGSQVRACPSSKRTLRIYAIHFIRDMFAYTAHAIATGSTTM